MRISDWSSDVCSSDLPEIVRAFAVAEDLSQGLHYNGIMSPAATNDPKCRSLGKLLCAQRHGPGGERDQRRRCVGSREIIHNIEWKVIAIQRLRPFTFEIGMRDRKSTRLNSSH